MPKRMQKQSKRVADDGREEEECSKRCERCEGKRGKVRGKISVRRSGKQTIGSCKVHRSAARSALSESAAEQACECASVESDRPGLRGTRQL